MKKLTTAQQKVIDTIKAGIAKFTGKTYEEVYDRKEDRTSYTEWIYEMAQKDFYMVYATKATIDSLVKKGMVETFGIYSLGCQLVKLVDTAEETKAEEPENKEEEETMKTTKTSTVTLNLNDGTVRFELDGTTYKYNQETKRYSKTVDGKTTRIGKAEYDEAKANHDIAWAAYEQEKLDKEPSRVKIENDLDKPAVLDEFGCVDCRKCNCDKCVHRDCMRRNPRNVGGLGECPRLDNGIMGEGQKIAEEEGIELAEAELEANIRNEQKKPARKPRKSKDIAYEGNGVTLTAKQVDFLLDLKQTNQWDGFDTMFWTDVICDEIEGQFAGKPMTVGAMVSTLCEKGLGYRATDSLTDMATGRSRKATYFALTELGQEIAKELGLE